MHVFISFMIYIYVLESLPYCAHTIHDFTLWSMNIILSYMCSKMNFFTFYTSDNFFPTGLYFKASFGVLCKIGKDVKICSFCKMALTLLAIKLTHFLLTVVFAFLFCDIVLESWCLIYYF